MTISESRPLRVCSAWLVIHSGGDIEGDLRGAGIDRKRDRGTLAPMSVKIGDRGLKGVRALREARDWRTGGTFGPCLTTHRERVSVGGPLQGPFIYPDAAVLVGHGEERSIRWNHVAFAGGGDRNSGRDLIRIEGEGPDVELGVIGTERQERLELAGGIDLAHGVSARDPCRALSGIDYQRLDSGITLMPLPRKRLALE